MPKNELNGYETVAISRAMGTRKKIDRLAKRMATDAAVRKVPIYQAIDTAVTEAIATRKERRSTTTSRSRPASTG